MPSSADAAHQHVLCFHELIDGYIGASYYSVNLHYVYPVQQKVGVIFGEENCAARFSFGNKYSILASIRARISKIMFHQNN